MKVSELIELLKNFPQDYEVVLEYDGSYYEAQRVGIILNDDREKVVEIS